MGQYLLGWVFGGCTLLNTIGEFSKALTQTCRDSNICQRFKRSPRKPVVGLEFGGGFNEVLLMDLENWRENSFS